MAWQTRLDVCRFGCAIAGSGKSLKVLIVLSLRSKLTILLSPVVFTTKDAAEKFAKEDPYVEGGIVTRSTISEWTVAIGSN